MRDERVERWLAALLTTPGLTSITDPAELRRVHLDDALAALDLVEAGPVVDVGSGGGSPGIPLAAALPRPSGDAARVVLAQVRVPRGARGRFPNVEVVCARAEEHAAGAGRDAYATALARALAPPPVAVEWCLPLVAPGRPARPLRGEADEEQVGSGGRRRSPDASRRSFAVPGSERRRLLVVEKLGPTPERFPRRPGVARKRPLA